MTHPTIHTVHLGGGANRPLLVLGPSVGTAARTLWGPVADQLTTDFHVVAWELPGHGTSPGFDDRPLTIAALAEGVLAALAALSSERGAAGEPFHYAGCSAGGSVGLQLALDAPERLRSLVAVCSAPSYGDAADWQQRAETVRADGTVAMLPISADFWFAPGFRGANPEVAEPLLDNLRRTDRHAYARINEALGGFDVRDQLAQISTPLLAIAGEHDRATPVTDSRTVTDRVPGARLHVLGDAAHLAPAEVPDTVATLIGEHTGSHDPPRRSAHA